MTLESKVKELCAAWASPSPPELLLLLLLFEPDPPELLVLPLLEPDPAALSTPVAVATEEVVVLDPFEPVPELLPPLLDDDDLDVEIEEAELVVWLPDLLPELPDPEDPELFSDPELFDPELFDPDLLLELPAELLLEPRPEPVEVEPAAVTVTVLYITLVEILWVAHCSWFG